MLNRALRMMEVDIIIKMGFFIKDLHLHIEQFHNEHFNDPQSVEKFVVYRGQGMSMIEFEQIRKQRVDLFLFMNQ